MNNYYFIGYRFESVLNERERDILLIKKMNTITILLDYKLLWNEMRKWKMRKHKQKLTHTYID